MGSLEGVVQARHALASGEVRRLRESLGLSIAEVADAYGCWPSAWAAWERGEVKPNARSSVRIARMLAHLRHLADELAKEPA